MTQSTTVEALGTLYRILAEFYESERAQLSPELIHLIFVDQLNGIITGYLTYENTERTAQTRLILSILSDPMLRLLALNSVIENVNVLNQQATSNKQLGFLLSHSPGIMVVLKEEMKKVLNQEMDKDTKDILTAKINILLRSYVEDFKFEVPPDLHANEFMSLLDLSLLLAQTDFSHRFLPFELLHGLKDTKVVVDVAQSDPEQPPEGSPEQEDSIFDIVFDDQWTDLLKIIDKITTLSSRDSALNEFDVGKIDAIILQLPDTLNPEIKSYLVSFSLLFQRSIGIKMMDGDSFLQIISLASTNDIHQLFVHGKKLASELTRNQMKSSLQKGIARQQISLLTAINTHLTGLFAQLENVEDEKKDQILNTNLDRIGFPELVVIFRTYFERDEVIEPSSQNQIKSLVQEIKLFVSLIPIEKLQQIIKKNPSLQDDDNLRAIFLMNNKLIKSVDSDNDRLSFGIWLLSKNTAQKKVVKVETLVDNLRGSYASEKILADEVFKRDYWQICQIYFSESAKKYIFEKRYQLYCDNKLPDLLGFFGVDSADQKDNLDEATELMTTRKNVRDIQLRIERLRSTQDIDFLKKWLSDSASKEKAKQIANKILDIMEEESIPANLKNVFLTQIQSLFTDNLYPYYDLNRLVSIIEAQDYKMSMWKSNLLDLFYRIVKKNPAPDNLLKAADFVASGRSNIKECEWLLPLIVKYLYPDEMTASQSLQEIFRNLYKMYKSGKLIADYPGIYRSYYNIISDNSWRKALRDQKISKPRISSAPQPVDEGEE